MSRGARNRSIQNILVESQQVDMSRNESKIQPGLIPRLLSAVLVVVLGSIGFVGLATPSAAEDAAILDPGSVAFDDLLSDEWDDAPTGYPDPFEDTNRSVFDFNRGVDKWVLDPVTKAYRSVVPKSARVAISRVFMNLGSTKILVNDLLQLEWLDATTTTARLLLNTSIGIGGLFDVAANLGMESHESDFGQTLALAAVPSGPYLVLPLLGPATIRDGLGKVVDGFFQPTYYLIGPANLFVGPTEILLYSGSSGISTRDRHFLELKALEESSVDFYSALRNGYYQKRIDEIWGNREEHRTSQEPGLD